MLWYNFPKYAASNKQLLLTLPWNQISYIECTHELHTRKDAILMTTTRVFQSGSSQAILIPQEMKTDKKEFCINKIGDIFVVYPADDPWAAAKEVTGTFPSDFMEDRAQPSWQDVPDREGL